MPDSRVLPSTAEIGALLRNAAGMRAAGESHDAIKALHLAAARDDLATIDRALILLEIANCHLAAGSWKHGHTALDLAGDVADPLESHIGSALRAMIAERKAWAFFRESKLDEALAIANPLREELEARAADEEAATLAALHNTLGGIAWQRSRLDEAVRHVTCAAELYTRAGDQLGSANTRTNLGILHFTSGRWPEAEAQFIESERIRAEIGCEAGRAANLLALGLSKMSRGDHATARQYLNDSLRLSNAHGEQYDAAHAEIALAQLELLGSNVENAATFIEAVLSRADCISDDERVQAESLKALTACERGVANRGIEIASQALDVARQYHLVESEADCLRALGVAYRRAHRYYEAETALLESISVARKAGDPYRRGLGVLELGVVRADIQAQIVNAQPPTRAYDEATRLFEELGARYDLDRVQTLKNSGR